MILRKLIFTFLFFPIGLLAQQINSSQVQSILTNHDTECNTPSPVYEDALRHRELLRPTIEEQRNNRSAAASIVVRVVVHRLSSSTGIEGPTDAVIEAAIDKARVEYAGGDICFSLDYINYVNDDTTLTVTPGNNGTYGPMIDTYFYPNHGDPDRIDAFIYPTEVNIAGVAGGIPSDYFCMGEQRLNSDWITFSHEMGHCLGLFHTHNRFALTCPNALKENIDGSNCSTAGDFICDTPADPNISPFTTNNLDTINCVFVGTSLTDCNGDSPYTPLVNNIMSYGGVCRIDFTTEQFDVMRAEILSGTTGPLVGEIAPLTLGINSGSVTGGEHHRTAMETITTALNATITISNNAKVYHTAGQKIILGQGFEAKPINGRYNGKVGDPCN